MNSFSHVLCIAVLSLLGLAARAQEGPIKPLTTFTENKGQWPAQVLYRATIPGGVLFVEESALTFVLHRGGDMEAHGHMLPAGTKPEPLRMHAYRVTFDGANKGGGEGRVKQGYYENFFLGRDPAKWGTGCGVYGEVWVKGIYPGIDLRVDGAQGLKYELLVAPGADPNTIRMRYEGQDEVELKDGRLQVRTTAGDVTEAAPVAWINSGFSEIPNAPVNCAFKQEGTTISFATSKRDRRGTLVIDPVFTFGSYSGSTADNFGFTATYDATGHLYGGGIVFGIGYPTMLGVLQPAFAGATIDCGISKFSPDGTAMIWSTYLGGATENEGPHSLVVNDNDELFVLGSTGSSDFPVTAGCFQDIYAGGPAVSLITNYGYQHFNGTDIFVAHFSADATSLIACTYVGGTNVDGLNVPPATSYNYGDPFRGEIVLDANQHPVVATSTSSTDMPVSLFAPFPVYNGGLQDGYVFRMDPTLAIMEWSTYFGGSATDACYSVQIANTGDVYVTGGSDSDDLPMGVLSYDPTANGGTDAFIAHFDPTGATLLSSTYTGTGAYDQSYFVQLNQLGEVYIVGQTHGGYPVTPGKYVNPNSSQFIHKFNHDLSASLWSTVIGSGVGNEDLSPSAFLVSDCGQIYLSGWGGVVNTFAQGTFSSTVGFPITPGAIQTTTDGSDFHLTVLDNDGATLAYATYFGSPTSSEHVDGGTSRFDKNGIVYQAVCAGCGGDSNFPTTPGAWSNTNNSFNCNLGVFKIDFEIGVFAIASATPTSGCAPATILFTNTSSGNVFSWDFGDGSAGSSAFAPSHLYTTPGIYSVTLIVSDSIGCDIPDTAVVQVTITSPNPVTPSFTIAQAGDCEPYLVTFTNTTPGMALGYFWNMGDGNSYTTEDVIHTYGGPGTYLVTLTVTDTTCGNTATVSQPVTVTEPQQINALFAASPSDFCTGLTVSTQNLTTGPGGLVYTWDMGDGTVLSGTNVTYTYLASGTYTISLLAYDPVCDDGQTFSVEVTVTEAAITGQELIVPNIFSPNNDGENDDFFPIPNARNYVELHVYNRWGQLIYETPGTYKPWDGRVPNGKPAPDGVYFYLLDYSFPCSGTDVKGREEGYVHIVR